MHPSRLSARQCRRSAIGAIARSPPAEFSSGCAWAPLRTRMVATIADNEGPSLAAPGDLPRSSSLVGAPAKRHCLAQVLFAYLRHPARSRMPALGDPLGPFAEPLGGAVAKR